MVPPYLKIIIDGRSEGGRLQQSTRSELQCREIRKSIKYIVLF